MTSQWLYLRNPFTGETKVLAPVDARRYRNYGWIAIDKRTYDEIQQTYAQLMMKRSLGQGKFREH